MKILSSWITQISDGLLKTFNILQHVVGSYEVLQEVAEAISTGVFDQTCKE